jgi:hypothetical protein
LWLITSPSHFSFPPSCLLLKRRGWRTGCQQSRNKALWIFHPPTVSANLCQYFAAGGRGGGNIGTEVYIARLRPQEPHHAEGETFHPPPPHRILLIKNSSRGDFFHPVVLSTVAHAT